MIYYYCNPLRLYLPKNAMIAEWFYFCTAMNLKNHEMISCFLEVIGFQLSNEENKALACLAAAQKKALERVVSPPPYTTLIQL
jgi:hypothetical protein